MSAFFLARYAECLLRSGVRWYNLTPMGLACCLLSLFLGKRITRLPKVTGNHWIYTFLYVACLYFPMCTEGRPIMIVILILQRICIYFKTRMALLELAVVDTREIVGHQGRASSTIIVQSSTVLLTDMAVPSTQCRYLVFDRYSFRWRHQA